MKEGVYLSAYLAPLKPWLDREDVTDVWINAPGTVWVETKDGTNTRFEAPELTETALLRLARQIAGAASQGLSREHPLLSATLPDGARVQVVAAPATRSSLALAIRKPSIADLSVEDLAKAGLFDPPAKTRPGAKEDGGLVAVLTKHGPGAFLKAAVKARKTIVISGGTASGKTTLLNALVKEIPERERLIAIEDAAEVRLTHPNALGLLAVRGDQGEAKLDADDLLAAALRMRPDRIMLGELRGREAFAFLRAVNSGHPGSITTVHADSASGAVDQIAMLALLSGVDLGWDKLHAYIEQVIDVIVQIERRDGERRVVDVRLSKALGASA
jgi:type IV secretion system protein VirB11